MKVLALDPGEKVGWARADVLPDGSWLDLKHGITPWRDMGLSMLYKHMNKSRQGWGYDVLVIESWRLFPQAAKLKIGSDFPEVQFIGQARLIAWAEGTKIVMQPPAKKKIALATMATANPELHEMCTRPIAHDDGHDQDALMHLWFYSWRLKHGNPT